MSASAPMPVAGGDDLPTVLLVDDTPQNIMVLAELLKPHYHIRAVNSGERALRVATSKPAPDLILLDIMMPEMDGREVCKKLKSDPATADIPIIFITAMSEQADEQHGLEMGAADYITKPFNPAIVLARVNTQIELKLARDRLVKQNEWLDREVHRRMRENLLIQELNIRALACIAEARDNETGLHIVRTQSYVEMLAEHLADEPGYRESLGVTRRAMITQAAPLHDIGKVGIPDAILLKPGKLTSEEFEVMKGHPKIGSEAINKAMTDALNAADDDVAELATEAFEFLNIADEIALNHHEKWDGSGYPAGKSGTDIPVSARLMAIADVFDALMSRRVYKPPMTLEEATDIILKGSGNHFDPAVVDAFMACRMRFADVAARFADAG